VRYSGSAKKMEGVNEAQHNTPAKGESKNCKRKGQRFTFNMVGPGLEEGDTSH